MRVVEPERARERRVKPEDDSDGDIDIVDFTGETGIGCLAELDAALLNTEGGNVGEEEEEEVLLEEERSGSVEIVRALDLARPGRGEVGLDAREATDVEAVEETIFGVIVGEVNVEVEVEVEGAVRMELLLC
jgi:hypothetical protein